jgi:hypothetical protein
MSDPPCQRAHDFIGFVPESRSLVDRAREGSAEARQKLCSLVYVIARLDMEGGTPHREIRDRLLAESGAGVGAAPFERAADVASSIDDALTGRPPMYPKWINLAALADLATAGGRASAVPGGEAAAADRSARRCIGP